MGANAIKMKIGGAPINEDVERVRLVREAVGPEVKVMVDANCAYRYYEAIEIAKKIERYDIFWFEEPVNPDDYRGHKLVSQATIIPIATGWACGTGRIAGRSAANMRSSMIRWNLTMPGILRLAVRCSVRRRIRSICRRSFPGMGSRAASTIAGSGGSTRT